MKETTAVLLGVLGAFIGILMIVSVLVGWGMYTQAQSTIKFRIAVEAGLQECQNVGSYDERWALECD